MSQAYSIKDLENICGIKAHTIRIWEKRYNLLNPERTDTNIRLYSIQSLQKLLNVSFLVNCGYKISRISKLSQEEIDEYVHSIVSDQTTIDRSFNDLKMAMLNYSASNFHETYDKMSKRFGFRRIFLEVFVPFLNEVGMLWQTNSINSSHEHFISGLIKQKLVAYIDSLQRNEITKKDKTFVLFLPAGEIHDLSLLFLNSIVLEEGYKSIYLGANISTDYLENLAGLQNHLVFASYFTISPKLNETLAYIEDFKERICKDSDHQLWVMGRNLQNVSIPYSIELKTIHSFEDFEKLIS